MRAAAELLTDEFIEIAPEHRRRIAATLHGGVQRLERIVQESLSYAELKTGAFSLDLQDLDICAAVEDIAGILIPSLVSKNQTLSVIRPQSALTVTADPARIIQLLTVLVNDAGNRAPEYTRLRIIVRHTESDVLIELSIAGLGIPESEQAMIFEEFYSGAEPDRLGATASPLGLATVKKTAQAHGGDIGVHSEDGELTVFTVRLPLVSKQ